MRIAKDKRENEKIQREKILRLRIMLTVFMLRISQVRIFFCVAFLPFFWVAIFFVHSFQASLHLKKKLITTSFSASRPDSRYRKGKDIKSRSKIIIFPAIKLFTWLPMSLYELLWASVCCHGNRVQWRDASIRQADETRAVTSAIFNPVFSHYRTSR